VTVVVDLAGLNGLPGGSHVCWVVDDEAWYGNLAAGYLGEGEDLAQKTVVFGPEGSCHLVALGEIAKTAVDPHAAFLEGRSLEPQTMFAVFREQSAIARAEGYEGLRVVADMDWLLSASPSSEDIIAFEVLLDHVVAELDATVICAYRRSSFDHSTIAGALCVHPLRFGHYEQPQFSLLAQNTDGWRLSGEVDLAGSFAFAAAFAATAQEPCILDVTGLDFIDVAGMRTIAETARSTEVSVQLHGARDTLRRNWQIAGFHEWAPTVELHP
jgi:anti-anti-sigma factor